MVLWRSGGTFTHEVEKLCIIKQVLDSLCSIIIMCCPVNGSTADDRKGFLVRVSRVRLWKRGHHVWFTVPIYYLRCSCPSALPDALWPGWAIPNEYIIFLVVFRNERSRGN
ncbi:hypothetical protein AVEN_50547-1 [Araneus ventricosus]|uniref:Uncharacterized protein n=1 Tax=Araneus ventricosus TaxID=182803 RepID=A0A4Y2APV7_ARAVE|nr:hypothetical protein AVEN_50547-1 [Araneus ventricosus]